MDSSRGVTQAGTEADIVIVGGGLCGLGAALACEEAGVDWQLLEQTRIGWGASGRNAGFLIRGAAENFARACRDMGRDSAKSLWKLTEANIARLESYGLTELSSFERRPSVVLAYTEEEAKELRDSARMLREDGFDVDVPSSGTDSLWRKYPPLAALANPGDAVVNPIELVSMLAERARAGTRAGNRTGARVGTGDGGAGTGAGVGKERIHEGVEVHAIDPVTDSSDARVEVRARDRILRARKVLVCTNAWGPLLLDELRDRVSPRRGQMLALRADGESLDAAYYSNFGSEYFRPGPDGLLVFGGRRLADEAGEVGYEDKTTPVVQEAIEEFARRIVGPSFEVVARWAGTMGFSPTGLPMTVEVRPNVWFCGGFTGHGMSMAVETAHQAVSSMLGSGAGH